MDSFIPNNYRVGFLGEGRLCQRQVHDRNSLTRMRVRRNFLMQQLPHYFSFYSITWISVFCQCFQLRIKTLCSAGTILRDTIFLSFNHGLVLILHKKELQCQRFRWSLVWFFMTALFQPPHNGTCSAQLHTAAVSEIRPAICSISKTADKRVWYARNPPACPTASLLVVHAVNQMMLQLSN